MENWRAEESAGEKNPERDLPERCIITIIMCNNDNDTELHIRLCIRKCPREPNFINLKKKTTT